MKAFAIDRYKGEVSAREVALPDLNPGDVLVKVAAASVNPLDLKIWNGDFKAILPYRFPLILGNDCAGTVMATGAGVSRFRVGDRVFARPADARMGTFAEQIIVAEDDLGLMPASLGFNEAASLPLVSLTAWQALVEIARVRPGQRVLIHAGSGGVGTVAVQLAKHLGAFVATTASTANAEFLRGLGADIVVDYTQQDFSSILSEYDVVLHSVGTDALAKSLSVLKPGGKLISISGPPDPEFARKIGAGWIVRQLMGFLSSGIRRRARKKGVSYSFLFMRADGAQLAEIAGLVDAGVIRPVVDRVFPFVETPAALTYAGSGRSRGKVVIDMVSGAVALEAGT